MEPTLTEFDEGVIAQLNAGLVLIEEQQAQNRHMERLLLYEERKCRTRTHWAVAGWLVAAVLIFARIILRW